jgi:hypothetical protein
MSGSWRRLAWMGLVTALLLVGQAWAITEYRVVFQDSSWVMATEKPSIIDGTATIRLPSGLKSVVDESEIDWDATEEVNRDLRVAQVAPTTPTREKPRQGGTLPGVITLVGEPGSEAPAAGAMPSEAVQAPPPQSPKQLEADQLTRLRVRIRALQAEIQLKQQQKNDLTRQAAGDWNLDKAAATRGKVQQLDSEIQKMRSDLSVLILQASNLAQKK